MTPEAELKNEEEIRAAIAANRAHIQEEVNGSKELIKKAGIKRPTNAMAHNELLKAIKRLRIEEPENNEYYEKEIIYTYLLKKYQERTKNRTERKTK